MYDIVLKGGEVIDPAEGIHQVRDVGIKNGKIAALEQDISVSEASEVIPVDGRLVTPGLIDMHCHPSAGLWRMAIDPDEIGLYSA